MYNPNVAPQRGWLAPVNINRQRMRGHHVIICLARATINFDMETACVASLVRSGINRGLLLGTQLIMVDQTTTITRIQARRAGADLEPTTPGAILYKQAVELGVVTNMAMFSRLCGMAP